MAFLLDSLSLETKRELIPSVTTPNPGIDLTSSLEMKPHE